MKHIDTNLQTFLSDTSIRDSPSDFLKLVNVPAGNSIGAFGKRFTVLDHTDDGVLVLSESIETNMPFRNECEARVASNDFRDSDICQYLNGEYRDNLINNDKNADAILDMKIDLKCTLGQHEYGTCTAKVGLLTLDQYGKYFNIIPKIDDYWWLVTPYMTPQYSLAPLNTNYIWNFNAKTGYYYYTHYSTSSGVRPALVLDSLLVVSCADVANNNTTQLSDFSNEELLEEIKRRL